MRECGKIALLAREEQGSPSEEEVAFYGAQYYSHGHCSAKETNPDSCRKGLIPFWGRAGRQLFRRGDYSSGS